MDALGKEKTTSEHTLTWKKGNAFMKTKMVLREHHLISFKLNAICLKLYILHDRYSENESYSLSLEEPSFNNNWNNQDTCVGFEHTISIPISAKQFSKLKMREIRNTKPGAVTQQHTNE